MKILKFIDGKIEWIAAVVIIAALGYIASIEGRRAQAQEPPPNPTAYVPEVRIGAAPAVPIATAVGYYSSIAPTTDPSLAAPASCSGQAAYRNAYVRELAQSLPADADEIFKFVHDNVSFSPTFGLKKGAGGAVLDEDGTAADHAQLLVELLRAKGFCARYVFGTAEATLAQIQTWVGVEDLESAERVFADGGIPVERTASTLKFAHVWVELYGASGNTAYDPSFKRRKPSQDAVDIAAAIGLTATSLRSALGGTGDVNTNRVFNSTTGIDSHLTAKAQSLAMLLYKNEQPSGLPASMQSIDFATLSLGNLLGIGEMLPYGAAPVTSAMRRPLSYVQTHQLWYEIPDRFRTFLNIQVGAETTANHQVTWYLQYQIPLDSVANAKLELRTTFFGEGTPTSQSSVGGLQLYLDNALLAETGNVPGWRESSPWYALVLTNMPYAATEGGSVGGYGDSQYMGRIDPRSYSTIFATSGNTSERRIRELSRAPHVDDTLLRNIWIGGNPATQALICRNRPGTPAQTTWIPIPGCVPNASRFGGGEWPGDGMQVFDNDDASCDPGEHFSDDAGWDAFTSPATPDQFGPCDIGDAPPATVDSTPLPHYYSAARTKARIALEWLSRESQIRAASTALTKTTSQAHIIVGFVSSSIEIDGWNNAVASDTLRLHTEPFISVNARQNVASSEQTARRNGMVAAYAAAGSALEGAVLRGEHPFAVSTASKFRWAVEFDISGTQSTNGNRTLEDFRDVNIDPEGRFVRVTHQQYAQLGSAIWNDTTGYFPGSKPGIEAKLAQGYDVVLPKLGTLGPEMFPTQRRYRPQGGIYADIDWYETVYRRGSTAIILINPTTGAVSQLVFSGADGVFKGGASGPELIGASIQRPIVGEQRAAKDPWSDLYQVDDRDGRLTFTLPADFSVGAEGAGLGLQLTYQSELAATNGRANGWTNNLHGWLTLESNSLAHFGVGRPAHAAGMLTALAAAIKLREATTDIDAVVGTELAMGWWTERLMHAGTTIGQGTAQTEFYRAPNGEFLAATPRGGSLKQVGAITAGRSVRTFMDPQQPGLIGPPTEDNAVAISFRYDRSQLSFVYRSADGQVRRFAYLEGFFPYPREPDNVGTFNEPVRIQCEPESTYCDYAAGLGRGEFKLTEIRTQCPVGSVDSVSLCAGRTLTFGAGVSDDLGNSLMIGEAAGRSLEFVYGARNGSKGETLNDLLTAVRLKDSASAIVWEYKFSYVNALGASVTSEFRPLLEKVWFPHDHVDPYVTFAYTADDRIDSVTRAGNKVYDYLATGHRTEVRDPNYSTILAAAINYFDANGRLFHSVDRVNRLSEFTHDGAGRVIEKRLRMRTDAATVYAERATYKSDVYDNVTETTVHPKSDATGSPPNIVTKAEFMNTDFPLLATKVTDALNRNVVYSYDPKGRLTQVDGAQGERIDTLYDTKGFASSIRSYTSASVYRALDFDYTTGGPHRGLVRKASVYSSAAPGNKLESEFTWDPVGNLTEARDPRDNAKAAQYDAARRMTDFREYEGPGAAGALKARQMFVYDLSGRLTQVKRAKTAAATSWAVTSAEYTATGRVWKIKNPDLDEDVFGYDNRDWLTSATDGEGRITAYNYDAAGRLTCERRGVGTALAQAYRSMGYGIFDSPTRLRPAKGSGTTDTCPEASTAYDTTFGFDDFGRDKTATFADTTTTVAMLNPASELATFKTRANQALTYTYDNSSREKTRATPDGAYAFDYDREGKRTSATFTSAVGGERTTTYTYDGFGRVVTEGRQDGRNIAYEYDDAGNRTAIVWPAPDNYRAEYVYDGLNRLIEVKVKPSGGTLETIARYTYDFQGRRTHLAYGPTTESPVSSITYAYEDDDDLIRLEHRFAPGGLVKVLRHAYDKSGKLKSSAANDTAWAPVQPTATRTYAAANVLDQYTTVTDGSSVSLGYDLNGNLISDGTWTFAYDAENRLLSADKTNTAVDFTYDALGRRQTKTLENASTNYLSAGDEEIAEYDGSGNLLRRYIPGPGTDQPVAMVTVSGGTNTIRYFHADRQGSVVAMADTSGALIEGPFTYDPYGNSADSSAGVPFRYTGRRLDSDTGLYYYRARYYSAISGRFLQVDPVGYQDSPNLYSYALNDPSNLTDPTGEDSVSCHITDGRLQGCNITIDDRDVTDYTFVVEITYYSNNQAIGTKTLINKGTLPGKFDGWWGTGTRRAIESQISQYVGRPFTFEDPSVVVAAAVPHRHHPWPKYLGGPVRQELERLPPSLHKRFHTGLDRILPRQWGKDYYDKLPPGARRNALRALKQYVQEFDKQHGTSLYKAMLRNGFPRDI